MSHLRRIWRPAARNGQENGQAVIVCTECDALWEQAEAQTDAASMLDVASFLAGLGLHGSWEELEVLVRLPSL